MEHRHTLYLIFRCACYHLQTHRHAYEYAYTVYARSHECICMNINFTLIHAHTFLCLSTYSAIRPLTSDTDTITLNPGFLDNDTCAKQRAIRRADRDGERKAGLSVTVSCKGNKRSLLGFWRSTTWPDPQPSADWAPNICFIYFLAIVLERSNTK